MRILHPLSHRPEVAWDRHAAVVARARGLRVLHLGCVDRGYEGRLASGALLHQKLADVTDGLWGVDLDAEGIAAMRAAGIPNLVAADVTHLDEAELPTDPAFDLVVAAELMEHLSAPGAFLEATRRWIGGAPTRLLITVPNAARLDSTLYGLLGHEVVHPDHVAWYSPRTLRALLERHGFEVLRTDVYATRSAVIRPDGDGHTRRSLVPRVLFRSLKRHLIPRAPLLADGLIVEARCDS